MADRDDYEVLGPEVDPAFPKRTQTKIEKGIAAWERIKSGQTWADWLAIGEAIDAARADLMDQHNISNDVGARWNSIWKPWLEKTGFDQIDQPTRSVLHKCIVHKAEIASWRSKQDDATRAALNHPTALWRRFYTKPEQKLGEEPKPSAQARQREEIHRLQEEVDDLRDETSWRDGDTPEEAAEKLASVLVENFPDEDARAIAAALPACVEELLRQRARLIALPAPMFDQPVGDSTDGAKVSVPS